MWMAVEIKSVPGLHWSQEWLPNQQKKLHPCGFQLLFRHGLYYMYLNVLLLTKLYFKQHVQWIIKDEEHGDTIVNIHVCPLQGGRGVALSSLCCIDCKIPFWDVKFEMRRPARPSFQ